MERKFQSYIFESEVNGSVVSVVPVLKVTLRNARGLVRHNLGLLRIQPSPLVYVRSIFVAPSFVRPRHRVLTSCCKLKINRFYQGPEHTKEVELMRATEQSNLVSWVAAVSKVIHTSLVTPISIFYERNFPTTTNMKSAKMPLQFYRVKSTKIT